MNSKNRTPNEIIKNITALLNELSFVLGSSAKNKRGRSRKTLAKSDTKKYSGPTGGIKMLIADNFFQRPKSLPEIVVYLRQEGFNYRRQVISMALLRAVRNRTLTRLEAEDRKGKEKWVYAKRK